MSTMRFGTLTGITTIAVISLVLGAATASADDSNDGASDMAQKAGAANKAKSTAVKALRDQENASIEQLRQEVDAHAPDADLTSTFSAIKSDMKAIQKAENDFWDAILEFQPITMVAKQFLNSHPPINPARTTAAAQKPQPKPAAKPAAPPAAPAQDWKTYFGATKEQQQKLDAANKAKNDNIKSLYEQRNSQIEQLREQVDASAADNILQPLFTAARSTEKAIQDTENGFWDTVAVFLTPMQQAKLFLRAHPKK